MAIAARIPTTPVTSSSLASHGYDPEAQTLAVEFRNGSIYHHSGVSQDEFDKFASAPSLGVHYNAQIAGKYPVERMTGPCPSCGANGWIGETCADCGCANHEAAKKKGK